jgi:site-specific recombinase XerC
VSRALVVAGARRVGAIGGRVIVPAIVAGAGERAGKRFPEFFVATIRNKNTRAAYYWAACHFFAWCEAAGVGELVGIEPLHVAAYIEALQDRLAKPTVKLHLAAIRMLFNWLVTGLVLAVNPAHAVRGPRHVVKRGKTPVLTSDQAHRRLIASTSRRPSACAIAPSSPS